MNNWQWKKKAALSEQLKFFGASKQKFISVYAKKPRILCKVKVDAKLSREYNKSPDAVEAEFQVQLSALYQEQRNRGMQHSAFGCNQMAAASAAMRQASMYHANIGVSNMAANGRAQLSNKLVGFQLS